MDIPQTSPFLLLPLELRLEIYSLLLHLPPSAILQNYHHYHNHNHPSRKVHPHILRANHQVNAEATHLLYAQNTFTAHPTLLVSFPRLSSHRPVSQPHPLSLIRRVFLRLRLDVDVPFTKEQASKAFSGLEVFRLQLVQTTYLGVGGGNLKCLEGVRGVSKVIIKGSTTGFESYVRWLEETMTKGVGEVVDDFDGEGIDRLAVGYYL